MLHIFRVGQTSSERRPPSAAPHLLLLSSSSVGQPFFFFICFGCLLFFFPCPDRLENRGWCSLSVEMRLIGRSLSVVGGCNEEPSEILNSFEIKAVKLVCGVTSYQRGEGFGGRGGGSGGWTVFLILYFQPIWILLNTGSDHLIPGQSLQKFTASPPPL